MNVFDLAVIGGGIAGTSAALTAATRGLRVIWIRRPPAANDQSLHWHGYLHRGYLYDRHAEKPLIDALRDSWRYWSHPSLAEFLVGAYPLIVGIRDTERTFQDENVHFGSASTIGITTLRPNVAAVVSDERILDGPGYLAAAWAATESRTDMIVGECLEIRYRSRAREITLTVFDGDDYADVRAAAVVIAAGVDSQRLAASVPVENRMSRMLVLHGELPGGAFIAPGPAWGGLFMVSRGQYEKPDRAQAWLVSYNYWTAYDSNTGLLDGWWTCSIIQRLGELVDRDALAGVRVSAYLAAKSRISGVGRIVSAESYAIADGNRIAAFCPSKWTLAPVAAIRLISDLFPATARASEIHMERMAHQIHAYARDRNSRPEEGWYADAPSLPFGELRKESADTLEKATFLFRRLPTSEAVSK